MSAQFQPRLLQIVPEGLERFHDLLLAALPRWNPDANTWQLVMLYRYRGNLNLEEQALLMATWLRDHPQRRQAKGTFVTNWLRRAAEKSTESVDAKTGEIRKQQVAPQRTNGRFDHLIKR
jgi:hypothetical protein